MSLANGRSYLAIPGPSVIPEAVLRAMHRSSPNIYEGELVDMIPQINSDLRYVCLLYTSPSPRDRTRSRMPSSA